MSNKEKHPRRIKEMINAEENLFQSDAERIKFYREWIAIQIINVNKALKRAEGKGGKNEAGFHNKGCGCHTCKMKYKKELAHLEDIKEKLARERFRQKGIHPDWEEDFVTALAQKKLDKIRSEREE